MPAAGDGAHGEYGSEADGRLSTRAVQSSKLSEV